MGQMESYPIAKLDEIMPTLMRRQKEVICQFGGQAEFDNKVIVWLNSIRLSSSKGKAPAELLMLNHLLHELRLYKKC